MSYPLISICIPTYNREDYIEQTIESALSQDYEFIEVIISDNCSSDNTQQVISKFLSDERVKYFKNDMNIGMVNNWNVILNRRLNGDWFMILSDDDYLIDSNYISKCVNLILENQVMLVYSNGYIEHTQFGVKEPLKLPYSNIEKGTKVFKSSYLIKPQAFTLCNIVFNVKLAKELDAFSNPANLCCDSELFLKSCLHGDIGVVDSFSSVYRYHGANLITQKRSYDQLIAIATDLYLAPYYLALQKGVLSESELSDYRNNVIDPALKDLFFCIAEIDFSLLKKATQIVGTNNYSIKHFFWDPIFIIKLLLTKTPTLLRISKKLKKVVK